MTFGNFGNIINEFVTLAQMEVRKAFYFMKEGFKNIESRFEESKRFEEEFKYEIEVLKKDQLILKEKTPRGERFRNTLQKIDIVARMYEFANDQQEVAYRMAHVFIISIYESFIKNAFKIVLKQKPSLLVSKNKSLLTIKALTDNKLKNLINKRLDNMANVDFLYDFMKNKFKVDLSTFPEWSDFREGFYRRHVIVHHHGIFSEKYQTNTSCSTSLIGTEIKSNFTYIENLKDNTINFIDHLSTQILLHFSWSFIGRSLTVQEILDKLKRNS